MEKFHDLPPVNFNPRSPYGERLIVGQIAESNHLFQSTLPLRGATAIDIRVEREKKFQSTLPLRGATWCLLLLEGGITISIHAPLTGSDTRREVRSPVGLHFNPRSPYGERRKQKKGGKIMRISIHAPLTGSDLIPMDTVRLMYNFNPRSPYGERPCSALFWCSTDDFNPRSPYGERPPRQLVGVHRRNFNPRSPYGERRAWSGRYTVDSRDFNPRSPYGERLACIILVKCRPNFNPRSPYGERLSGKISVSTAFQFQSTLPLRGATIVVKETQKVIGISIHAPLTGSDPKCGTTENANLDFNPRSPYGERPKCGTTENANLDFNPRSPYGERRASPVR